MSLLVQPFTYDHAETVPVTALQVGDVVLKPGHPDRPYRITRVKLRHGSGRIKVRAVSVYAKWGVGAVTFGAFSPTETVQRAAVTP